MEPRKAFLASSFWLVLIIFLTISLYGVKASSEEHHVTPHVGPVVEKGQRRTLIDTEYGEISSIDIKGGHRAPPYHLQFFTLEPNSVFLPVLLHANMVFYVHTGSGRLTWADEDGTGKIDLREGDLCKLSEGSLFYIYSNLEAERKKLRIYAMFANTDDTTYDPSIGAYSRINELVKGFDNKIIQAAFKVPEDMIEAITNKTDTPAIVHANSKEQRTFWELEASVLKNFLGIRSNAKKVKTYNIFGNDPDFKNCHGWSLTVTKKQLKSLKGTNTGFLMVNLTTGSMLGPHWNPRATEIALVVQGEGMVRVVCGSSNNNDKMEECQNMRFKVKEGDLFVVPKFHPMAQMSFNNDSLVFLGFSTAAKENSPQFLAGKRSVLGVLDRHILATSFGVSNTTIDQLFASQDDSIIFGCVSCAEEEEKIMKEEIEMKEEEEEKKREEEEEERKRKEEEAKKREEEEEKERRKEEAEEARKREEEEARRQQEERERRREEEEARRQREAQKEQEEARKEEERRREEEAQKEQEQARREQEERERKKEEEARRERERERREEEEEQEQESEEERARSQKEAQREEEQARRQQEERERRRQEEEAKREQERRQEEEAKREQERRQEEEAEKEQERARRGEEEAAQREQEQARRQQEERERRREEEEARREQERGTQKEESERERQGGKRRQRRGDKGRSQEQVEEAEWEQEEARRQQEERERRREQEGGGQVEVKGNRSSFEGRRVLKIQNI